MQVCAPNTVTRVHTARYRIVFMRYRIVFIPRAALVHPVSGFGAALAHLLLQLFCLERFCCYALCTILFRDMPLGFSVQGLGYTAFNAIRFALLYHSRSLLPAFGFRFGG